MLHLYLPGDGNKYFMAKAYRRSGNFRVTFFRIRNVRVFNFRRVAKWRKINVRVRARKKFSRVSFSPPNQLAKNF